MWFKKIAILVSLVWLVLVSSGAFSTDTEKVITPHELIGEITEKLIVAIEQHRETFAEDPQPFYQELSSLLDQALDYKWISYNVMGPYRKQATPEQRERFAEKFRSDLIETYGGGLVAFGDQEIVVLPPDEDINGLRTVRVSQEIRSEGNTYPLQYTMGQKRSGEWKITNVIINGINLGKTFRNQFIQRAQKFDGDLDQVIDNWSSAVSTDA